MDCHVHVMLSPTTCLTRYGGGESNAGRQPDAIFLLKAKLEALDEIKISCNKVMQVFDLRSSKDAKHFYHL